MSKYKIVKVGDSYQIKKKILLFFWCSIKHSIDMGHTILYYTCIFDTFEKAEEYLVLRYAKSKQKEVKYKTKLTPKYYTVKELERMASELNRN